MKTENGSDEGGGWLNGHLKKGALLGIPATALIALLSAAYINVVQVIDKSNDVSAVALDIAKENRGELRTIQSSHRELVGQITVITTQLRSGFSDTEAKAMEERVMERIRMIERRIDSIDLKK